MRCDLRYRLLYVECVTRINHGQAWNGAHHRQIFCGLVAWSVAGSETGQGTTNFDVQIFFCNDLMNEVISAACAKHSIGGGKWHQPRFGHATCCAHQQLFSHAHLKKALWVGLCKQM